MYGMPLSLFPNIADLYKKLGVFAEELADVDEEITVGIVSEGEASAYANVWEWGNVRQTKKGPKTTRGINPNGEEVWLTIQAPYGYIRVNEMKYRQIMIAEVDKVDFGLTDGHKLDKQLKAALLRIDKKILKVLQDTVPVDTEALKDSLRAYSMAEMTDVDED